MDDRRRSDVELALLRNDMEEMKLSVAELKTSIADLLEGWRTATGLVKFIKWAATIVTSIGILYVAAKDHVRW